ncbi:hypothetical protein V6N12_074306 [Hibiscus sabdariffa]|uniref:Uncharacterized protein n=1 Tax=Hibiscus sabdariffa TaxID=183260 RepID=A0ABR2BKV5_9ROSI
MIFISRHVNFNEEVFPAASSNSVSTNVAASSEFQSTPLTVPSCDSKVVTPTDGHPAPCNVAATSENEHEGSTPADCDVDMNQDLENEAESVGPFLVPTDPVGVTTADSLSEQTLSAVGVDQTVEVAVESNVG